MTLVNALKIAVALAVAGGLVTLLFRLATARDIAPVPRGRKEGP